MIEIHFCLKIKVIFRLSMLLPSRQILVALPVCLLLYVLWLNGARWAYSV